MGKVTDKTLARAEAGVEYAEARLDVKKYKAGYDAETDPVKKAKAYLALTRARQKSQAAGKVIRPRKRKG